MIQGKQGAGGQKRTVAAGSPLPPFVFPVTRLVLSDKVGNWCQLPYPDHPKGCPNYGREKRCPPQAPPVGEYFDLSRPLYLVHSEFDLSAWEAAMKTAHPHWSQRQCRCVLYWQPSSRKQLKERAAEAMRLLDLNAIAMVPEAMGVNVYVTALLSGLRLEHIRGLKTCRHVALLGSLRDKKDGWLF